VPDGSRLSASPGLALSVPAMATSFCWCVSPNEVTMVQAALAFVLLVLPWWSYLDWKQANSRDFPLYTILASMNWIYFVLPLFFGDRIIEGFPEPISQELITKTLFLALLGVVCLGIGMRTPISVCNPARLPDLADTPMSWPYLRVVMVLGIMMGLRGFSLYAFGEGGRQIMILLKTAVPCAVFSFFFRKYVLGIAAPIDKLLIYVFLISQAVVGLSSGWLGTLAWPGILCALIYVTEGRKIPVLAFSVVVGCVLFLQVGKSAFRDVYWNGQSQGTLLERSKYWIEQSTSRWSDAIEGKDIESSTGLASETVARLSLLTQAGHVLDWTPQIVPFQEGATYSYIVVTLIPRFFWREKPSMSKANQFYQVAYGLTAPDQLNTVSIAVGFFT
jgi:hypothetical protein